MMSKSKIIIGQNSHPKLKYIYVSLKYKESLADYLLQNQGQEMNSDKICEENTNTKNYDYIIEKSPFWVSVVRGSRQ